jgi:hypothetical protein
VLLGGASRLGFAVAILVEQQQPSSARLESGNRVVCAISKEVRELVETCFRFSPASMH